MIRTWPGQTYEEWLKEKRRDDALTPEERDCEMKEYMKKVNEKWKEHKQEDQKKKQTAEEYFRYCDHPNSLENDEATILWLVVMAIGTIFKGNWIIWIISTIIWRRYITRHKRR